MILDTFLYLFEADTSDLEKGQKNAEKQADKLDDKLKDVDKTADNLGSSFMDVIATAGGALTALLSFGALASGIAQTTEYVDNLAKTARLLGENTNELAAFQELVVKSGGDVGGFQSSIKSLNQQFTEFVTTGNTGALPFMQRLGISMVDANGNARKVLDVLPELADAFQGLSAGEAAGLGSKLGLDEGTIALLQQGRREVESQLRRQKELFSITSAQAKVFESFKDSVSDTSTAFRGLFVELGADVLPILEYLLGKVQDLTIWFKENKTFVTATFIALGTAITAYALPAIIKMGIATVTAFAPFYVIGGIVAGVSVALGLLYDDLSAFLTGGTSAFEKLLRYFGATDEGVEKVKNGIFALGDAVVAFGDFVADVFKNMINFILDPINYIKELISLILEAVGLIKPLTAVTGAIGGAVGAVTDTASGVVKGVANTAGGIAKGAAEFFGFGSSEPQPEGNAINKNKPQVQPQPEGNAINKNKPQVQPQPIKYVIDEIFEISAKFFGFGGNEAQLQPVPVVNNNRSSNVSIGKIEVITQSTDAEGISREIGATLGDQLRNTTATYEDGFDA